MLNNEKYFLFFFKEFINIKKAQFYWALLYVFLDYHE